MSDDVFQPSFEDLLQLCSMGMNNSVILWNDMNSLQSKEFIIAKANALLNQNKYNEACELLENLNIDDIQNPLVLNTYFEILLESYIKINKYSGISLILQNPIFDNLDKSIKLNILAGKCYLKIDRTPYMENKAFPFILTAYTQYPYSFELVEMLISLGYTDFVPHPNNPAFNSYLEARRLMHIRQYNQAKNVLIEIDRNSPNLIPVITQICICCHMTKDANGFKLYSAKLPPNEMEIVDIRANYLKEANEVDKLNDLVVNALNIDQLNPNAWVAFSYLQELKKESTKALHITNHALVLDPSSWRANYRQGSLRFAKGEINSVKKAKESFLRCHRIRPEIDTFIALTQCELFIGNKEAAVVYAIEACNTFPDVTTPDGAMAVTLLGISQCKTDPAEARSLLLKALGSDPENMDALGCLVDMNIEEQQFEDALNLLSQFENSKNQFFIQYKYAEVYTFMKDYEQALRHIDNAIQIRPNNDRANELRGHIINLVGPMEEEDANQGRIFI